MSFILELQSVTEAYLMTGVMINIPDSSKIFFHFYENIKLRLLGKLWKPNFFLLGTIWTNELASFECKPSASSET